VPEVIAAPPPPAASADDFAFPPGLGPRRFLVLGPLPISRPRGSQGSAGEGEHDALATLGGAPAARLRGDSRLTIDGRTVAAREATLDDRAVLDLSALLGPDVDDRTAYAYAEWDMSRDSAALAVFGSDDGAVVWVNGRLVHSEQVERPLDPTQDRFPVQLTRGVNRVLVKVDNHLGGWGFALRLLDAAGVEQFRVAEARRNLEAIGAAPESDDYQIHDALPQLAWSSPAEAMHIMKGPPKVTWYGPDLEPVSPTDYPSAYGQYSAVVDGETRDAFPVRQVVTFAKVPAGVLPSIPSPPTREPPFIDVPWRFEASFDDAQRAELSRHFWRGAFSSLRAGPDAAVAALAMWHLAKNASLRASNHAASVAGEPLWLSSGYIQVAEHDLALRRKLEGRPAVSLPPPAPLPSPAPELRTGDAAAAGFRDDTPRKLRDVATRWARVDSHPFVVLVARHGVVVFHEGYNGWSKDSRFFPASLGKTVAALTFGRAVDHGILGFDQPAGAVLPDWSHGPAAGVTFRDCFYHVSGLGGHASHGGMFNAYLDNALAVEDEAFARPRARYRYNGDDVNLAGKALELTTGESIWRLLYDHMQRPFGEPVDQLDLGFGDAFTAMYLAKIGQMILQDGKYGRYAFFSPGFLKSMMPRRVADFAPGFDDPSLETGIGLAWMVDPPGPRDRGLLGPNVIGHGASSGSVWRVDPDHDVVIVVGRSGFSDAVVHQTWVNALVGAVAAGLTR
jgi:CubicO group peptidase (beta-lactamase class C family)